MKPVSAFSNFPEFASAGARNAPGVAKYAAGFVPSDTFPAEWANYFFHGATKGISDLNAAVYSVWTELASILSAYSITASSAESEQLLAAISKIYPQAAQCTTPAQSAQKSVSLQGAAIKSGCSLFVTMEEGNDYGDGISTWPTLSVNSGTPYPICDASGRYAKAGAWEAGDTVVLLFTGTKWLMQAQGVADSVAEGNFRPVTSNAVAQALRITNGLVTPCDRWLRFYGGNRKALVIKGGTAITVGNHTYSAENDAIYDLSDSITEAGKDYFVYLNYTDGGAWALTAGRQKTADTETSRYIGRFHTLCVAVASTTTMISPAAPSSGIVVGNSYLVKSYNADTDPDFFDLYNKSVTAINAQTYYDVVTCGHPLAGFSAGDILPESVWCLTWKPDCKYDDAMVYDKDTGIAVDVYLQSGKGDASRSQYNAVHTVSRQQWNHQEDARMVGKRLLKDYQFTSIALGSNECTNISGSADATTTGGHVDTANRRMTSAIGCEECCGYLWQWIDELGPTGGSSWAARDGHGSFGQGYGVPYCLRAGGVWSDGVPCGSRCRSAAYVRSSVLAYVGCRFSSRVVVR